MTTEAPTPDTEVRWISQREFYETVMVIYLMLGIVWNRNTSGWLDGIVGFFFLGMAIWYGSKWHRLRDSLPGNQ